MELTPLTARRFLTHALEQLLATADRVPEPLLNARPLGDGTNSIAALVVHCCGVVEYWLGHVAGGDPTSRDRDAELSATATFVELRTFVAATLERASAHIERLGTPRTTDVADRPPLYGGDKSDAAIVLHVLEECFQHLGHAELTADALTAGDRVR